jgi:SAM-dependent methyltransferase
MENRSLSRDLFGEVYQRVRYRLALAKAWYYDKKLGIAAEGSFNPQEGEKPCEDGNKYSPAFYGRLERMVDYLKLGAEDVFVDMGCGKGRVVFFVALQKIKKVIGVEVDDSLIAAARENLGNLRVRNSPIELVHADGADFDVSEGTVFYMFNPFGLKTVEKVISRIKESLTGHPRKIRIVYYAPEHCGLLDNQDWLIREGEIENKHCLVWRTL